MAKYFTSIIALLFSILCLATARDVSHKRHYRSLDPYVYITHCGEKLCWELTNEHFFYPEIKVQNAIYNAFERLMYTIESGHNQLERHAIRPEVRNFLSDWYGTEKFWNTTLEPYSDSIVKAKAIYPTELYADDDETYWVVGDGHYKQIIFSVKCISRSAEQKTRSRPLLVVPTDKNVYELHDFQIKNVEVNNGCQKKYYPNF